MKPGKESACFRPTHWRDQLLAAYMGPQFPWYWSAGVLFGLSLISLWILTLSIKSLDRLK